MADCRYASGAMHVEADVAPIAMLGRAGMQTDARPYVGARRPAMGDDCTLDG